MSFTNPIVENPYPYAYALNIASANTLYEAVENLVSGVYTITFSGGGTLNVDFYNGTTYIGTATSSSSPFLYNLGTQATNFKFWCTTSSSLVISLTALSLSETSGIAYSYSTSQTINLTGDAYAILIGGGQGGGSGSGYGGGRSGNVWVGRVYLNGSTVLTIGAGSAGALSGSNSPASTPGETTLGTYSSANGSSAAGGTIPSNGNGSSGNLTSATNTTFSFLSNLTTSSGGGGGNTNSTSSYTGGSAPAGTLGTGGTGGTGIYNAAPGNGSSGTGYGSGGGGGGGSGGIYGSGGAGSNGYCFIVI